MGWLSWFRRKPTVDDDTDDAGDAGDAGDTGDTPDADDVVTPQLADELDLHTFQPREVADLVAEYLGAAQDAGFATVRIIHGKGKGTLRRTVHAVLDRHAAVRGYRLGDQRGGSWGATLVEIAPKSERRDDEHDQLPDRGGDGDGR